MITTVQSVNQSIDQIIGIGESGYYQYIWACFDKWPVHRSHAS